MNTKGLDPVLGEEVGEIIATMLSKGHPGRLDPRKLESLAFNGVWAFLMSHYATWNWEDWEGDESSSYSEESTRAAWEFMLTSIQEYTGLSEGEAWTFAHTLIEVQDMGDQFETPEEFVTSAEGVDDVFGGRMKRIDGYREKARRVLLTILALLLVDDGNLCGRRLIS